MAMVVHTVVCVVTLLLAVGQSLGQSLSADEGCNEDIFGDTERRVAVPLDASLGFIVTSVAFIGQSMVIDENGCSRSNSTRRFDILPNGDVIVVSDLVDLLHHEINLIINSNLKVESWIDRLLVRVVDGSDMVRFSQNSYEGHVSESLPAGSTVMGLENLVARVEGIDPGSLRYALVDGPSHLFELVRHRDGSLTLLTRESFDREIESQYLLTIAAVVHVGNQDPAFTRVWVHIDNVNDNEPVMSKAVYDAHVLESDKLGKEIIVIEATDADGDKIEYSLTGGDGNFDVHRNNGTVFLRRPANVLSDASYEMRVYATDVDGIPSRSSALRVVVDGRSPSKRTFYPNSRARREVRAMKQIEVPESMVGEVLDLDNNYYEIFALKEPAPKNLDIHPATGTVRLRTGEKFDYETQREINFTILITRVDDPSC